MHFLLLRRTLAKVLFLTRRLHTILPKFITQTQVEPGVGVHNSVVAPDLEPVLGLILQIHFGRNLQT
jgi:hypothetical protein